MFNLIPTIFKTSKYKTKVMLKHCKVAKYECNVYYYIGIIYIVVLYTYMYTILIYYIV